MKEFSELTLQKLNADGEYYVYGLIDPRSEKLFYIGKGTGNRVFQHVIESDKNPESEKAKLLTIKDIELSGNSVRHILINWGLSESEAFASEATLINLINYISPDALTNIVSGHHSVGCMTVEEIEQNYGALPLGLDDFTHKTLIIKINKLYNRKMTMEELYDIVRGVWRADINKVQQVEYVLGVYNNLIVCCYKPDRWYKIENCPKDKLPKHIQNANLSAFSSRVFFECDDIYSLDEVQTYFLNKSIEALGYIQKSQNPITYIGF